MLAAKSALVADDEPGMRFLIAQAFSAAGCEVFTADDGKPAIRIMETRHIDLAIIDIIMPDKEGVETIMEIRKRWPACKIIAISGGGVVSADTHLTLACALGADAAMSKPMAICDLVALAGRLLEVRSRHRAVIQIRETEPLLDALDGIAYWTDSDGRIGGGAARNWRLSAAANGAPQLELGGLVGRSLFDFIEGDDVRGLYRDLHALVLSERRNKVTFTFRCDSPSVHRLMRMTIGAITGDGAVLGVLYHSQIIEQRERPPMAVLAVDDAARQLITDDAPVIGVCSFCNAVRQAGAGGVWGSPEDYYRAGGGSMVRLSHGVCPSCAAGMARV